jgi:polysaccharide pyruvyl transferase WcaK-like protein
MLKTARRAIIVNAYSYRNAGDAAIMLATAQLMRDLGHNNIALATRYEEDASSYLNWDVQTFGPLVKFPTRGDSSSVQRILQFLVSIATTSFLVLMTKPIRRFGFTQQFLKRALPGLAPVLESDTAVIAGGGYLYSSKRRLNLSLIHSCVSIWLCKELSPRTLMMPASIGPITRRFDSLIIQFALHGVRVVIRETNTLAASKFRPQFKELIVCPDVAFYGVETTPSTRLDDNFARKETSGDRKDVVRVVAMDWSWSQSVNTSAFENYVIDMAVICDGLSNLGYDVELGGHSSIPEHGQDDIATCLAIQKHCVSSVAVDADCDVEHLWMRYGQVGAVVGTRLHACIMATSVGTPVVVLGYQEKARGVSSMINERLPFFWVDNLDPAAVVVAVGDVIGTPTTDVAAELKTRIGVTYAE